MAQPSTPPEKEKLPKPRVRRRRIEWLPFLLILPSILVLLVIQVYPIFYTAYLSVQTREPDGWKFVGFRNFELLLQSSRMGESLGHTLIFLVGYASLTLALAFMIALLLNRKTSFANTSITFLFIPWILADIIAGVIFRLLVLPDYGILSGILQNPALFPPTGLSILTDNAPRPWIGSFPFPPSPAMVYLILAATWRALPFITLLLLASLQTVSAEVIESSRIDGANGWQTTRFIIIPLILPTLVVALFNLTLGGINGVGMVFSLTNGGPGTATNVLSYLLFTLGWVDLEFGGAAAFALMLSVVNLALMGGTVLLTRVQRSV